VPSAYHVYAIVRRHTPLPVVRAKSRVTLAAIPWRDLAAVTERLGVDAPRVSMQAVVHHASIVEAVRKQGPALPVRFGTVFRDAPSVAAAIAQRYEPLTADLDRLGDKVEVSLTALWKAPAAQQALEPAAVDGSDVRLNAGSRYLLERAAELRREDASRERAGFLARELDLALGDQALARRVLLIPTPRVAVRATYLLDAGHVGLFRTLFDGVSRHRGDVSLLLTGPWPPYSFVTRPEAPHGMSADDLRADLAQILTRNPDAPRLSGRGAQVNH
jgi:hypothetical protein